MKWCIPNGRGKALLQLESREDKTALAEALANAGALPKDWATFRDLLQSCLRLEEDLAEARKR